MKSRFSLDFWNRPRAARRVAVLVASNILMGLGVAIFNSVGFGVDPCSTFSMGLSIWTGIRYGTCQLLMNLALFIPVLLLDASRIGLGTLANMVLVGYSADFFMTLISRLFTPASPLPVRLVWFGVGLLVFLPAVALYVTVDLGVAPYDAGSQILAAKARRSYRVMRIFWDVAFLAMGWAMGATIGLTTLLTGFCVGPAITAIGRRAERLFV